MARSFLALLLGLVLVAVTSHPTVEAHGGNHGEQQHFVLVHGLGHGAWCWYKITTLLQQAGHQVTAIDLTSNGNSKVVADTVTSLAEYIQPLTQFLANDVQAPNKVILVGHSLGGSSITYAMEKFSEKINKAIFVAAFMPSNNQTFIPTDILQALGPLLQQGVVIQNFANGALMPPTSFSINLAYARDFFYNESPLQDVNLAKSLLNPTPGTPTTTEVLTLTSAKYGSIKRYYIKTGLDKIIVPALQANIIQQNPPHEEFFIQQSDHSPFFSQHVILNGLLLSIAKK